MLGSVLSVVLRPLVYFGHKVLYSHRGSPTKLGWASHAKVTCAVVGREVIWLMGVTTMVSNVTAMQCKLANNPANGLVNNSVHNR
jgi:hypothetical protein